VGFANHDPPDTGCARSDGGAAQKQRRDQPALSVDQSSQPDFEIPGTGLGLKTIENILRQLFHREPGTSRKNSSSAESGPGSFQRAD
jgi:hypothetical protein